MKQELWPVVVQDASTGQVLMLAYANEEALRLTLETGQGWYWSRSRNKLWRKGETSGHTQRVIEVRVDCDGDAFLYLVEQTGPACHTGEKTCFFRKVGGLEELPVGENPVADGPAGDFDLDVLYRRVLSRIEERPEGSYVASLVGRGKSRVLQKIGEEAVEAILAMCETGDGDTSRAVAEIADLWFHCLVGMAILGISPKEVIAELARRRR